jgi:hypothetical protein
MNPPMNPDTLALALLATTHPDDLANLLELSSDRRAAADALINETIDSHDELDAIFANCSPDDIESALIDDFDSIRDLLISIMPAA